MLCGFVNAREYYIFFTSYMALKNDASTFTNLQKFKKQVWINYKCSYEPPNRDHTPFT